PPAPDAGGTGGRSAVVLVRRSVQAQGVALVAQHGQRLHRHAAHADLHNGGRPGAGDGLALGDGVALLHLQAAQAVEDALDAAAVVNDDGVAGGAAQILGQQDAAGGGADQLVAAAGGQHHVVRHAGGAVVDVGGALGGVAAHIFRRAVGFGHLQAAQQRLHKAVLGPVQPGAGLVQQGLDLGGGVLRADVGADPPAAAGDVGVAEAAAVDGQFQLLGIAVGLHGDGL